MKIPSLVVSVLFVVAIAIVNALLGYFNVGGPGADYAYSAIIVAIVSAIGRYVQEQQKTSVTNTVTTADGTVMRRAAAKPVKAKNPTAEALMG